MAGVLNEVKVSQMLKAFREMLNRPILSDLAAVNKMNDELSSFLTHPDTGSYKNFAKFSREAYEVVFSVFQKSATNQSALETITKFFSSFYKPLSECKAVKTKDFQEFVLKNLNETCVETHKKESQFSKHMRSLLSHFRWFINETKDRSLAKPTIELVITLTMFEGSSDAIETAYNYLSKYDFFNFRNFPDETIHLAKRIFELSLKVTKFFFSNLKLKNFLNK